MDGHYSGRLSMNVQPALHLLGYELYVASITKSNLPEMTHPLLQLTLKLLSSVPGSRRNHFFSFTETEDEYSLILDDRLLKELKASAGLGCMTVAPGKWRPMVVEIGPFGSLTGISKIAANVIGPLADREVSVFCLSTNQDDYVMVKESDLKRVLDCLSCRFKLVCDSESESDLQLVDSVTRSGLNVDTNFYHSPCRPIIHPFSCSECKYHVCGVLSQSLPSITLPLLQVMFYSSRQEGPVSSSTTSERPFFNIAIIEDDITLVLDSRDIERFPEECVYSTESYWKLIRIGAGALGFDECGIVAQVSYPLAQAEISTYYICTFRNDHMLIPDGYVEKALSILNKNFSSATPKSIQSLALKDIVTSKSAAIPPLSHHYQFTNPA